MNETDEHTDLKQVAKTMLVNMDFKLDEIYEEHRVNVNNYSSRTRYFIVDICGIKKDYNDRIIKSVAIECGLTNAEKLVNLNLFFDEVYHLPYGIKKVDTFNQVYEDAINEITSLRNQVGDLKNENRSLERSKDILTQKIVKWRKAEILIRVIDKMLFPGGYYYGVSDDEVYKILQFLEEDKVG